MSLSCVLLRRRILPHLQGELGPHAAAGLDRHLARCGRCAARLSRLRAGHEAGRSFGRLGPAAAARLPSFEETRTAWQARRSPFVVLTAGLAAVAGLVAIVVVTGRNTALREGQASTGSFTQMSIRDFGSRDRSRVVTEGYVQNVYYDEQEQSLHIKLAESPLGQGPFVICEVRDARDLTIPVAGSRIRVYGTARYDGQPGRGWNEVNPVLEIAVLNR